MPIYHRLGEVPHKRHTAFHSSAGALYSEELFGNKGFTGPSSLLYHLRPPTQVTEVKRIKEIRYEPDREQKFQPRHFTTGKIPPAQSLSLDRTPLLFNHDVAMLFVKATEPDKHFYRNAQGDELVYINEGEGTLESQMGELSFRPGDYLVIPRGIAHRFRFDAAHVSALIFESAGYIRTPTRYRNEYGQLMENSPFCERDIRRPEALPIFDECGNFSLLIKRDNCLTEATLAHHPFDVVGWDGYYYPWAFNIGDFEPRVGRVHLPPPFHQTFEGDGFVVCSFCPRPYDFDRNAVPAPYNHSNVMSEEVIFYASSEFMSRKGIEYGSVTLHPDGFAHGPHPGRAEASIGQKFTNELAVMLDTFRPLTISRQATEIEDHNYFRSWLEE